MRTGLRDGHGDGPTWVGTLVQSIALVSNGGTSNPYHRTATWVGTPVRPVALVSNGGTPNPVHASDPSRRNPAAHMCRPTAGPIATKLHLANLRCAGPISCEKESDLLNERKHACAPCSSGRSVYNLR